MHILINKNICKASSSHETRKKRNPEIELEIHRKHKIDKIKYIDYFYTY